MFKLLVFITFLVTSSTFDLLETLYDIQKDCYSGCRANYVDDLLNLDACKQGCNYKLHAKNCAEQCKLISMYESIQASCVMGCSMSHTEVKQSIKKPPLDSIILIDQRPSFDSNSIDTMNNIKKQSNENTNEFKHIIIHQVDPFNRIEPFIKDIRHKSNQIISKQPKLTFIFLSISILLSAILSYMIVSLFQKRPKDKTLLIHSQELILEKDILQSDSPVKNV